MKRSVIPYLIIALTVVVLFTLPTAALAQSEQPPAGESQPLVLYTQYPSRVIGIGEGVNLPLKLRAGKLQRVALEVADLPEGWTVTFKGGGQVVDAVYVDGVNEATVDMRVETPEDVQAGKYDLTVRGIGEGARADLKLSFTIAEKLPPRLSLTVDGLPTKRGTPSGVFTFTADLKNEGGEDLLVSLSASQPENIRVTVESASQEVYELQLAANETKSLTIKADPLVTLEAGKYPVTVQAMAGDVKAELQLVLEVVGEGNLSVSGVDGRLSTSAYAGKQNPLKVVLTNSGTAPLRGIELTSSEPSGWSVKFDQAQIAELQAGQSVEVSAQITPPEKAVAGDYVVTINARPVDGARKSAEFRIMVRTSTMWGAAGIGLIALAVAVAGVAVVRFGRR